MFTPSLDLKQTQFWRIGGRYTDFLRVDSLFWGDGGGGLSAVSKAELRFPILFIELQVCAMRNLCSNCAKE
jgi:hypothetical protein